MKFMRMDVAEQEYDGWSFVDKDRVEYFAHNERETTDIGIVDGEAFPVYSGDLPTLIKVLQAAYLEYSNRQ